MYRGQHPGLASMIDYIAEGRVSAIRYFKTRTLESPAGRNAG